MSIPTPADLAAWRARIDEWEEGVVADARLAGAVPIIDYRDRPFAVPPEVDAELRRRADPRWREGRARDSADARRGASGRRRLAEMLRERGDGAGAAAQDAAADRLDAEAVLAVTEAGGGP